MTSLNSSSNSDKTETTSKVVVSVLLFAVHRFPYVILANEFDWIADKNAFHLKSYNVHTKASKSGLAKSRILIILY